MIYSRIIYTIWLRQLKRYYRSKARMIGSLGQPVLLLLALGFGFGPIYQKAGGGNYLEFLAPGIVAMGILFMAVFSGIEVIWDKQFGFLKEMLVAPVPRIAIMVGMTLGGATVAAIQGIIILLISLIAGFRPSSIAMIPLALLVMAVIAVIFTALGTALASVMDDMHGFPLVVNFLIMPLFFLSGALFPLKDLPYALIFSAKVNPLAYGVDALRFALTGVSNFGLFADFAVLCTVGLLFLLAGSWLFSRMQV